MDLKLSKLGTVMLGVRDLERSLAFYRDALGLPVQFAGEGFVFLNAGGVTIAIRKVSALPEVGGPGRTELVFHVDDVDEAHRALRARGVVFRIEPRIVTGDQLAADFRDPDGHVLSIFGPRRAAGSGKG